MMAAGCRRQRYGGCLAHCLKASKTEKGPAGTNKHGQDPARAGRAVERPGARRTASRVEDDEAELATEVLEPEFCW
jgi:hypothetical protein